MTQRMMEKQKMKKEKAEMDTKHRLWHRQVHVAETEGAEVENIPTRD
jgi:hypothetical protein